MLRAASAVVAARPSMRARAFASGTFARGADSVSASPSDSAEPRIPVGATFSTTRTFTEADVAAFASVIEDPNPIHVDARAARSAGFEGTVVHGMLCAGMFGAVIGATFPGAVYATQSLSFRAPVLVGQAVKAEVTLTRITGRKASFDTTVRVFPEKHEGDESAAAIAVDGKALALLPPRSRESGAR